MKRIPELLKFHLEEPVTSYCFLIRIVCKNGRVFGFSSTDFDIRYDPGEGEVLFKARESLSPNNLEMAADFSVDNTDLTGSISEITERDVRAGLLDSAEVTIYRVNYRNLSAGHEIVAHGTAGEPTFGSNRSWTVEFRSLTQQLKQSITENYSLTCRAEFGDNRCKMPLQWYDGEVLSVGIDPHRQFTLSVLMPDGFFDLGIVEFTTGGNARVQVEVDTYNEGGVVQLNYMTPYPVRVGDQVRIRRDCDKSYEMCRNVYNNVINMRAEPFIPVENSGVMTPGAEAKKVY